MAKRPADPPITQALADSFLEAYAWMARSRHARDRLAYRICEWQRDRISQMLLERGEPNWAERVRK